MEDCVSRILIETIVRKTLRDMREAPERNLRNLVDRALTVSKGRFQKVFFQTVQRMLHNDHSMYYALVRHVVDQVDHERLLGVGINIGYQSCTAGARTIRELEAKEGFNIPWSLFVDIDVRRFAQHEQSYRSLIEQGKELGIFTWLIRVNGFSFELFQLLGEHPECAFGLMCSPGHFTEAFAEEAAQLNNLIIGVGIAAETDEICACLRERKLLYSIYLEYTDENAGDVLNDKLLHDTQSTHAPFTVLMPKAPCSRTLQSQVYEHVKQIRAQQQFPTILWELFQDSMMIDTIISADGCSAGFQADGSFFRFAGQQAQPRFNMQEHSLKEMFKANLTK